MSLKAVLILVVLAASSGLSAEDLRAYLPDKAAAKAMRLLALIDKTSSAIDSKRAGARTEELRARAEAVEAYALVTASRGSQSAWASSDGSALSVGAPQACTAARSRAKTATRLIAAVGDAKEEGTSLPALISARDSASSSLADLILGSGIGSKSSSSLERLLADKSAVFSKLFPEAAEVAALLVKSGPAGGRLAAAALANRPPLDIAGYLIDSRDRIGELAPSAMSDLSQLATVSAAYRSWETAFPVAAYPGDLASASTEDRATLAAGISAIAGLPPGRAAALFDSLVEGDARETAEAESARLLAGIWEKLPEARRVEFAAICGVPYYSLALFASAIFSADETRQPSQAATNAPKAADWLSILSSLNGLEIAIADEESGVGAGASGTRPEPALLLLERPELEGIVAGETRYASLYAEATHRLSGLYAQAAEEASTRLEASSALARSSALALGSPPKIISVRSIDLKMPAAGRGRWIAFFATATDVSGISVSIPLPASAAAAEYATAFAKAASLRTGSKGSAKPDTASMLAKYGQYVVSAYDPEGSNDSLVIDVFPRAGGPQRPPIVGDADLESALLGGWRP